MVCLDSVNKPLLYHQSEWGTSCLVSWRVILTAARVSLTPCCHSFASGSLDFWLRDYFWLGARCIVHSCAWRNYTISLDHIIWPKSQPGVVDTPATGNMH